MPSGGCDHQDEGVDAARLPSYLRERDADTQLPRLGGMARPNGVVIVSERFWAFAGTDGSLREGPMPARRERLSEVPFVRGLLRLAAALSPIFTGTGVTSRRERLLLAAALLAPVVTVLLPHPVRVAVGFALTIALVGWLLRGRTLNLHGAEHRAITSAEERRLAAAWEGSARPSRFSLRCGTNLAALVIPVSLAFTALWDLPTAAFTPLAVTLLSLALTMELWQVVQDRGGRLARIVLAPGLALQRLTTREPSLDETRVALTAVASVLRRELESARAR